MGHPPVHVLEYRCTCRFEPTGEIGNIGETGRCKRVAVARGSVTDTSRVVLAHAAQLPIRCHHDAADVVGADGHGDRLDSHFRERGRLEGQLVALVDSSHPEFTLGVYSLISEFLAPLLIGREFETPVALLDALRPFKGNPFAKAGLEAQA